MNLLLLIVPTLVTSLKGTNFLLPFTETEKRNHLILDCLPAGQTVRRKVSLSLFLWICLYVSGSLFLSLVVYVCISLPLTLSECLCLAFRVSICLSSSLSVNLCTCLSLSPSSKLTQPTELKPNGPLSPSLSQLFHLMSSILSLLQIRSTSPPPIDRQLLFFYCTTDEPTDVTHESGGHQSDLICLPAILYICLSVQFHWQIFVSF